MPSLQKLNYDLRQPISDVEFDPEDPFNELKILPCIILSPRNNFDLSTGCFSRIFIIDIGCLGDTYFEFYFLELPSGEEVPPASL